MSSPRVHRRAIALEIIDPHLLLSPQPTATFTLQCFPPVSIRDLRVGLTAMCGLEGSEMVEGNLGKVILAKALTAQRAPPSTIHMLANNSQPNLSSGSSPIDAMHEDRAPRGLLAPHREARQLTSEAMLTTRIRVDGAASSGPAASESEKSPSSKSVSSSVAPEQHRHGPPPEHWWPLESGTAPTQQSHCCQSRPSSGTVPSRMPSHRRLHEQELQAEKH